MKPHVFALVDCNNFYVSCERLFCAELRDRPVIVLSNNDGCVVARSKEAKALGIAMGQPLFQCQELITKHQVAVYSSNYALYQELSDRVMSVLKRCTPALEVYSIDEAWLSLDHVPYDKLDQYAQQIRQRVLQETGIPVSVGIASTKTLSKVACELVKRHGMFDGVLNMLPWPEEEVDAWLAGIHVEDIWGIGPQLSKKLRARGIYSARNLKLANHAWIRHYLNVTAQRVVLELQGVSCLPIQIYAKPKKGIMVSLAFGRPVEELGELEEALSTYTASAAETLRKQHSLTSQIHVFLQTNPFAKHIPQYAMSASASLPFASAFTPDLLDLALALLHTIYRPGYQYKRTGIYLTQIRPHYVVQRDLFGIFSPEAFARQMQLMTTVDEFNRYWGRNTLYFGTQAGCKAWFMKQTRRSQRATTRWEEILTVS